MGRSSGKKLQNRAKTRGVLLGGLGTVQAPPGKWSSFVSKIDFKQLFSKLRQEAIDRGKISSEALKLKFDQNLQDTDLSALNLGHSQFGEVIVSGSFAGPGLSTSFQDSVFNRTWLRESVFQGCNFSDSEFLSTRMLDCSCAGASFDNAIFSISESGLDSNKSIVNGCNFYNASFEGVKIEPDCHFTDNNFESCTLSSSAEFEKINFSGSKFKDMEFYQVSFRDSNLYSAVFENCDMDATDFAYCSLKNARFESTFPGQTRSLMTDINFYDSDLTGAVFNKIAFERPFFPSQIIMDNVNVNNSTISHSAFVEVSISNSTFEKTIFSDVDFTESDLSSTVFLDCEFHDCNFKDCVLPKTIQDSVFKNCTGIED